MRATHCNFNRNVMGLGRYHVIRWSLGISTNGNISRPPETSTGGFLEAFYCFGALKGGGNLLDRCKSRVIRQTDSTPRLVKLFKRTYSSAVIHRSMRIPRLGIPLCHASYSPSVCEKPGEGGTAVWIEDVTGVRHGISRPSTFSLRNEYLVTENRILRNQITEARVQLSGWRTHAGHHRQAAGEASPRGSGEHRQARYHPRLALQARGPEV